MVPSVPRLLVGLGLLELILATEERFGVSIRDEELEHVRTVGDLTALVVRLQREHGTAEPLCRTSRAFYRLRRGLMRATGVIAGGELLLGEVAGAVHGTTVLPVQSASPLHDPPCSMQRSSTQRRMASEYDTTIRVFQPSYDDMLRLSTDFARVLAPGRFRCLDYGTGTGAALPGLLHHFDEVVGVDPQPAMLEVARARVSSQLVANAPRVSFVEGNGLSPEIASLPDASFDAAHCSLVLMFVEGGDSKLATLRVLHRLLRPQGVLVLTELLLDWSKGWDILAGGAHCPRATQGEAQ